MLASAVRSSAADKRDVRWSELAAVAEGKKIALVLPDGAELRGRVTAVQADTLVLDVSKTSDKTAHPKGSATLPRSSVRSFTVGRTGWKWRAIGTAIGLGGGLAAGVFINEYSHNEGDGAPAAVAAAIAVPAALGYLGGWAADRGTVTYQVIP